MGAVRRFLRRQVERILATLLADEMGRRGWDRARALRLATREIAAIRTTLIEQDSYQRSEAEILNERLSRRYDPGLALNEAASRAIKAKVAARQPSPDNLSAKQKAALKFQEEYLRRVVKNA